MNIAHKSTGCCLEIGDVNGGIFKGIVALY